MLFSPVRKMYEMGLPLTVQLQNRHSPIIVGERYELAETLALKQGGDQNGGRLGKPDYQTALLSMSGCDGKDGSACIDGMLAPTTVERSTIDRSTLAVLRDHLYALQG